MLLQFAALVILGTVAASLSEAQSGFTVPPESLVARLRREHHRRDWLRITTASNRYEARVREIGAQGLGGLSSRRKWATVPDSIPWSSVARIDRESSSFRIGQVVGFAAGGALGLLIDSRSELPPEASVRIVAVGATAGALVGARLGGRRVRRDSLYVALPLSDSAALAREPASGPFGSSPQPGSGSADFVAQAVPVRPDSIGIERALRRLRPSQLLRIRGEFGESGRVAEFEGFVARAGRDGLEGLRPRRAGDPSSSWPQELGWDRIGRIDRRGTSAGHGAFVGAATLAPPGFVVGLVATAVRAQNGSTAEVLGGGLLGAAISGTVGAALGGLIGSAIPRWHLVYGRR